MIYTALQREDVSWQRPANLSVHWNVIYGIGGANVTKTLYNESGVSTGGTFTPTLLPYPGVANLLYTEDGATFGEAQWVDESTIVNNAIGARSDPTVIKFTGFVVGDTYYVEFFGSQQTDPDRKLVVSVNGTTPIVYENFDNLSQTVVVETTADVNGELNVEMTGQGFQAYAQAIRIYDQSEAPIRFSLPQSPVYSESFTGTYSNFSTIPPSSNAVTISDGTRSISVPVTVTDNGDGTGSFTGTMPSLPPAGQSLPAGSLVFPGSINVTLTDLGA